MNRASQVYNIPYATLGDKLRGRRPIAASRGNFLTEDEEKSLSAWLVRMAKLGFGKTREDVKDMAKRILDERDAKTRAKDNRPGKNWMNGFLARHEQILSEKKPMSLGRKRAVVTAPGIQKWFEEMKENLDAIDPTLLNSPHRLYNADESGFQFKAGERKVMAFKGSKTVYSDSLNNERQVTVLVAMSAAGHYLQPLVIYPYKQIPDKGLLDDFPEAALQVSDNGWINATIFHNWLRDVFIPSVKDVPKPVVLFVDGHASHTSLMETSSLCEENQVVLYCLKAHSSHLILPLGQAFFGAIKSAWTNALRQFVAKNGEAVGLDTFGQVFRPVWRAAITAENAMSSFSASGIFPFNPNIVLNSGKLADNTPTAESPEATTIPTDPETRTVPSGSILRQLVEFAFEMGPEKTFKFFEGQHSADEEEEFSKFSKFVEDLASGPSSTPRNRLEQELKLPSFPKTKGGIRKQATLPVFISEGEFRECLQKKEAEKEEESKGKERKKREREEAKKKGDKERLKTKRLSEEKNEETMRKRREAEGITKEKKKERGEVRKAKMEKKRKIEDRESESEEDSEVEKFEKKMRREMEGVDQVEVIYYAKDKNHGCQTSGPSLEIRAEQIPQHQVPGWIEAEFFCV